MQLSRNSTEGFATREKHFSNLDFHLTEKQCFVHEMYADRASVPFLHTDRESHSSNVILRSSEKTLRFLITSFCFNGSNNASQLIWKVLIQQLTFCRLPRRKHCTAFNCLCEAALASSAKSLSCLSAIVLRWSLTLDTVIPAYC